MPAVAESQRLAAGALLLAAVALTPGCGGSGAAAPRAARISIAGSAVGAEADVLRRQVGRFMERHPDIEVRIRETPDSADLRHQLYVQWLNAWLGEPDVLQIDVVWTAELAAAGWILPLDRFHPETSGFAEGAVRAARWRGKLWALPWFVDAGMLYWRTDILGDEPPPTLETMRASAERVLASRERGPLKYGFVWQGARYEGLVCVFLEHLGAFGGEILDDEGRVRVDSPEAVRALTFMVQTVNSRAIPEEILRTWREEQTRFAFQNGEALFMRNWPYAREAMSGADSRVAGRFATAAMPGAEGGHPTAALGGSLLAINSRSKHPEAAWKLVDFLTQPDQMLERAEMTGQFPARMDLYTDPAYAPRLGEALHEPAADVAAIVRSAVARPSTPVYSEMSGILQIYLHRAISKQMEPREALEVAAREMRALLRRTGLSGPDGGGDG